MRLLPVLQEARIPAIPNSNTAITIERRQIDEFAAVTSVEPSFDVGCLACPEHPCASWLADETLPAPFSGRDSVCPVDAISLVVPGRGLSIRAECFGCGLCALRCPYGAVAVVDDRAISPPAMAPEFVDATEQEFQNFDRELTRTFNGDIEKSVQQLVRAAAMTGKYAFYGLVAGLLTSIGIPTVLGNPGDTSSRFDAIAPDAAESMPIEVKSPTESQYLTIKSVQQALENKVVMTARAFAPTTRETSTLAVGYMYPADRSDVVRLINDIFDTYGISVGMIDLASLYRLVMRRLWLGETVDVSAIRHLRGAL